MKAVTSDRLGLGTGRQAPALSTLHMCRLGPSWGAAFSSTIPYPAPPPSVQQTTADSCVEVSVPQGLGPFGCADQNMTGWWWVGS